MARHVLQRLVAACRGARSAPSRPCRTGAGGSCRGCRARNCRPRSGNTACAPSGGSADRPRASTSSRTKVGQRDFAGGNQVQRGGLPGCPRLLPPFLAANRSPSNLGNCPVPRRRVGVDDVGGVTLGVAVLLGLHVEHELRQRPVQTRDGPLSTVKRAPVSLTPMSKSSPSGEPTSTWSLTGKSICAAYPSAQHHVAGLVGAHRHAGVRQVGHGQQQVCSSACICSSRVAEDSSSSLMDGHLGHGGVDLRLRGRPWT
jgi:hypothetical protein